MTRECGADTWRWRCSSPSKSPTTMAWRRDRPRPRAPGVRRGQRRWWVDEAPLGREAGRRSREGGAVASAFAVMCARAILISHQMPRALGWAYYLRPPRLCGNSWADGAHVSPITQSNQHRIREKNGKGPILPPNRFNHHV